MALSRALKDVLRKENGMVPKSKNREHHAEGGEVGQQKRMQDMPTNKGNQKSQPGFKNLR